MEIGSFETLRPSGQQHNNPKNQISPHPKKQKKLPKLIENGARATQNGTRIDQKWSQHRETCAEPPKVATRWLPRPFGSMMGTHFYQFLGPLWDPKIDQNLILGPKKGARKLFVIDFSSDNRFSHFRAWIFINFG